MKYCPSCGNLLDGKFECSCGWVGDKDECVLSSNPIVTDFKTGVMTNFYDASSVSISKVESDDNLEKIIEDEQVKYESKNGIVCNYTPFSFTATINGKIVGAIAGATFFKEVYIDELVVVDEYRGFDIGTKLVKAVEDYYKDSGFNNINTCTNEFQAPGFYEKCGFELEFVRKNKDDSKFNKYFYVKYF